MGGIRIKFPVIFLFCVWIVTDNSKAHEGGHHGSHHANQMIVTKQSVVQIPESPDTNKCIALLRRTVVRKELLTYPCFHPVPGVVPVVAHQTPMGLVCRGYTNTPTTQYIRLPTCCPGSHPDHRGRCVKDVPETQQQDNKEPQQYEQAPSKRLEELPKYPASYENKRKEVFRKIMSQPRHWMPHPVIMRRIDAIMKQRKHLLEQLKKNMEEPNQQQGPPRTAVSDLFPSIPHPLLGNQQQAATAPEIPRPSQQQAAVEEESHSHHHHHHRNMPHHHHQMSAELHAALHKNNIPHSHDNQGNPQLHELKHNAAFLQQQEQFKQQMEARTQMQRSRQQQLLMLQQQRQNALAMRQQMLQQRRMQQAQLQQQQMMQQMRNAAQQSLRQMPLIPRPQTPAVQPYVVQRTFTSDNSQFPNVPNVRASVMMAVSPNSFQHFVHKTIQQNFPSIPQHPMARYQVQLPRIPVESPPVSISPGPNSPFKLFSKCRHHHHQMHPETAPAVLAVVIDAQQPSSCYAQYMMVLKKCFNAAGVDIPVDHNMFNVNFNYNGVCEKREMIMACIFDNLSNCNTPQEQHLVKTTIGHTVDEMNRFCQIGQINGIEERLGGRGDMMPLDMQQEQQPEMFEAQTEQIQEMPVQEMPIIPQSFPQDHHTMSLGQHELTHEVKHEEVDEFPKINEVPSQPKPEQETPEKTMEPVKEDKKPEIKISEHEDSENIPGNAHAHVHDDDHTHDGPITIQELREESFYLPILIGTAIGVAGIFVLLLAILCICCRRRLHKKMYIEKETEKPKLFDVYTIGVPPPVYEVNGIPPISYEEAKGEKFTGSPASVRRNNAENETQQQRVPTVSGTVSDI